MCRKHHGSAFATFVVTPADALTLTAGADEVSAVGIDDDLANDRFESLFGAERVVSQYEAAYARVLGR